jgi:hypothetical protein
MFRFCSLRSSCAANEHATPKFKVAQVILRFAAFGVLVGGAADRLIAQKPATSLIPAAVLTSRLPTHLSLEAQMTLLFAAYIGLSATLAIGFCSAMIVTAQEGDD